MVSAIAIGKNLSKLMIPISLSLGSALKAKGLLKSI